MKNILFLFLFFPMFIKSQTERQLDSIRNLGMNAIQTKTREIIPLLKKNIKSAREHKNKATEAKANSLLSLTMYYAGDYEANREYALAAIRLYEELNDFESLASEYGELGFRLKDTDLKSAEQFMLKGLLIAEKSGFKRPLQSIYNNYGVIKLKMSQQDSALLYYKKGVDVKLVTLDSVGLPYSYNNIGDLYLRQKKHKQAKHYFDEAMKIRLRLNDQYGISDNYAYSGDLFLDQRLYDSAIVVYLKSLEIAERLRITNLMLHDYKMLTNSYEGTGDFMNALKFANRRQEFGDSLLNIETNAKIAEYQIQFETAEKEKQLLQHQLLERKRKTTITILLLLISSGLLIGFLIVRALRLRNKQQRQEFELKEAITTIETQNKLQEQRLAISRDLHDNIGAQLTFIISAVETLKYAFRITDEKINNKLLSIAGFAKETITELRDTIWAMNHSEIDFGEIHGRIFNFVEKARKSNEQITFSFEVDEQLKTIVFSSVEGMNIYRIIQESVNNALKYAEAKSIEISAKRIKNEIYIVVHDDGKGFNPLTADFGNGLQNMKKRAVEIAAEFEVRSGTGEGTEVILIINR
ncbi:MAG: hypothetical protein J0G96_02260 [Flavobacteriia bacterium]|nr:hypothetical protein [Flavobacteriia bacterium]